MDIYEVLKEVGLTQKEGEIYTSLLQYGPLSILALSRQTKIHRPVLYKNIDDLIDKGILRSTIQGNRKKFFAVPPQQLINYIKRKEELLESSLPLFSAFTVTKNEKPKITYYEGRSQLLELYKTGLECASGQLYTFFPSKYMAEVFGKKPMEKIIKERVRRKIWADVLRSKESEDTFLDSDLKDRELRRVRYIPDDKKLTMGVIIFDNKVNLFSPMRENFGIQIESDAYSELMKYFFQGLWSLSRENP